MKTRICRICGTDLGANIKCPYCGGLYVDETDPDAKVRLEKIGKQKRQEIVNKLTDFSIEIHKYQYSAEKKEFIELSNTISKIADGHDCDGKIVWSKEGFAQDQEVGKNKELTITYKYEGKEKQLVFKVTTVRTSDWWKLGIKIEQNLHLSVYLGTSEKNCGSSLNMSLELM